MVALTKIVFVNFLKKENLLISEICSLIIIKNKYTSSMGKRKANSNNPNNDFCEFLGELAEYEKNINRNIHKYQAYRKAVATLATYPTRIKSGHEAKSLPGIGEKISKKIDEFLQTGKLKKLENIHQDKSSQIINLLTRVSGIGPVKAQKLFSDGIMTLDDLRKNQDKLTHHQIIGLRYFDDFEKRIPRAEIHEIENILKREITEVDPKYEIIICGSYRRGKPESGDIDTLITHPDYTSDKFNKKHKIMVLKSIIEKLKKCGLVTETISLGDTKFMGACRLNPDLPTRRLDIRFQPYDQYFCSVLYFTGSDVFNQKMRAHALEKQFTLNEYTLRPLGCTGIPGEPVEITSERDIFDIIEYPYKKPEEREN
ncbi:DNA polymerase beta-like isoform X2 [Sitophilus oryzae]|uniref:DNA polymerase n=1 Tax=Sitophilus oryzae TaxID=7048 RepID=A0A6J2X849_SITOR|nr:DNA polymerase beta-like isoform X2 [Sitophilus oryzae]